MAEKTGQQLSWGYGAGGYGGSWLGGYGYSFTTSAGTVINPPVAAVRGSGAFQGTNAYDVPNAYVGGDWNVGGYGNAFPGTYANYQLMLDHPTIALACLAVTCPILAAGWRYEADTKRAPADAKELVERVFSRIRTDLLSQMLRAVFVGCQSFEPVWEPDDIDGAIVPARVKPLLQELTNPLVDKNGNLLGLENSNVKLQAPGSYVHHVHARRGSNWYGWGRLEAARRQWSNWLSDDDEGFLLAKKSTAIVPYIGYPAQRETAEQLAAAGKVSNGALAIQLGQAMQQRKVIAYKNFAGLDPDDVERNADLAGKSDWSFNTLDMGDTGASQAALTEKMRYRDQLLCRAIGRSERSVIEANTAGSRADASAHTADIGDTDADILHASACDTVSRQLVDYLLVENYGPKAKGTVWIAPEQIVDERRAMLDKFIDAINADPLTRKQLLDQIDMNAIAQATGLKLRENVEPIEDVAVSVPEPVTGVPTDGNNAADE